MRVSTPFGSWKTVLLLLLVAGLAIALVALAGAAGPATSGPLQSPADEEVLYQVPAEQAAITGTWLMVDYGGSDPAGDILRRVNSAAEGLGVPDSSGVPGDALNDFIRVYYIDFAGLCVPLGDNCWELHAGPNVLPAEARGLQVDIRAITLKSTQSGLGEARARYRPDGGLLPIAANEYWQGTQGHCPYLHCGEPYSFVRNPAEPPPFSSSDGGLTWQRNACPNPYDDNTCQGPYNGAGENYGQALALMGADAKSNYGSSDPRCLVHLDYRYDALVNGGHWHWLMASDQWVHNIEPAGTKAEMWEVIVSGGYTKQPIPAALHEPPPAYIDGWGYCWALPHNEDNCFNYPESGRPEPYDVLEFLSGADSAALAALMYDNGGYVNGRYAPGQHVVVAIYNGYAASQWGTGGNKDDAAVLVGYFGATIVGYGNTFAYPCAGTPGDWTSYAACVQGTPNTLYAIAGSPLAIDPSQLLEEWLPKQVEIIP